MCDLLNEFDEFHNQENRLNYVDGCNFCSQFLKMLWNIRGRKFNRSHCYSIFEIASDLINYGYPKFQKLINHLRSETKNSHVVISFGLNDNKDEMSDKQEDYNPTENKSYVDNLRRFSNKLIDNVISHRESYNDSDIERFIEFAVTQSHFGKFNIGLFAYCFISKLQEYITSNRIKNVVIHTHSSGYDNDLNGLMMARCYGNRIFKSVENYSLRVISNDSDFQFYSTLLFGSFNDSSAFKPYQILKVFRICFDDLINDQLDLGLIPIIPTTTDVFEMVSTLLSKPNDFHIKPEEVNSEIIHDCANKIFKTINPSKSELCLFGFKVINFSAAKGRFELRVRDILSRQITEFHEQDFQLVCEFLKDFGFNLSPNIVMSKRRFNANFDKNGTKYVRNFSDDNNSIVLSDDTLPAYILNELRKLA